MLADEVGHHEYHAFKLIVIDRFDERVEWRAKQSLVHEFDLVAQVRNGMHVVCNVVEIIELML